MKCLGKGDNKVMTVYEFGYLLGVLFSLGVLVFIIGYFPYTFHKAKNKTK